jgi:hypothetical protein
MHWPKSRQEEAQKGIPNQGKDEQATEQAVMVEVES